MKHQLPRAGRFFGLSYADQSKYLKDPARVMILKEEGGFDELLIATENLIKGRSVTITEPCTLEDADLLAILQQMSK